MLFGGLRDPRPATALRGSGFQHTHEHTPYTWASASLVFTLHSCLIGDTQRVQERLYIRLYTYNQYILAHILYRVLTVAVKTVEVS